MMSTSDWRELLSKDPVIAAYFVRLLAAARKDVEQGTASQDVVDAVRTIDWYADRGH